MENINIQTTQNVYIEHNVASVGERVVAQALDLLILFSYLIGTIIILSILRTYSTALYLIAILPFFVYSLMMELLANGQTVGKMVMRTRVVKLDGSAPGFVGYLLRWLFRIIDIWFINSAIGMTSIILNKRNQRLGDLTAGTTVIRMKENTGLGNTILKHVPEDYELVFPSVQNLDENDIQIIADVISHCRLVYNQKSIQLINRLRDEIEKKMNIESEQTNAQFLETVITDYNFIHRGTNGNR